MAADRMARCMDCQQALDVGCKLVDRALVPVPDTKIVDTALVVDFDMRNLEFDMEAVYLSKPDTVDDPPFR